jgi:hypothetical protein
MYLNRSGSTASPQFSGWRMRGLLQHLAELLSGGPNVHCSLSRASS